MEGVTDIAFRHVVARAARPDVFFTEFTNVSSYASAAGRANALARLRFEPTEMPIVPQIWGSNPEHFALTAAGLKDLGYQSIDLNLGCPDRHVIATGGGSALIRTPELAVQIIAATKSAGLPVSVKTRLGYTHPDEWRNWLTTLLQQDLAALTVHLRTKKEMSKVAAHYELIPDLIALRNTVAPQTKLYLNGDFTDLESGRPYLEQGADGLMIGRGVFANPFCFERTPRAHTQQEYLDLLLYHLDQYEHYGLAPYDPLKRFFKIYINSFPGAADLRAQLMETRDLDAARQIIYNYQKGANYA
jgi:tRNA-dihydrouridine synthase